jgi:hypothetical protein
VFLTREAGDRDGGGAGRASQRLYQKELNRNPSGNEIHYTNSLMLLVNNMLCSKLHCQRGFNSILISLKIVPWGR